MRTNVWTRVIHPLMENYPTVVYGYGPYVINAIWASFRIYNWSGRHVYWILVLTNFWLFNSDVLLLVFLAVLYMNIFISVLLNK